MRSLTSKNRGVKCLLYVIDIFTRYAWVETLKDKANAVLHRFIKIVNEYKRKQNKLQVDEGTELYNNPIQKWLVTNDILIYLTHNEGKPVIAERFIRTLKAKIYEK